jgi:hypothetical protein
VHRKLDLAAQVPYAVSLDNYPQPMTEATKGPGSGPHQPDNSAQHAHYQHRYNYDVCHNNQHLASQHNDNIILLNMNNESNEQHSNLLYKLDNDQPDIKQQQHLQQQQQQHPDIIDSNLQEGLIELKYSEQRRQSMQEDHNDCQSDEEQQATVSGRYRDQANCEQSQVQPGDEQKQQQREGENNAVDLYSDNDGEKHPGGRPRLPLPDLDSPLYDDSDKKLGEVLVHILEFVTANGVSQSAHRQLLQLIKSILPASNKMVDVATWRRILKYQGLIQPNRREICINGCIVYTDEFEKDKECRVCKEPRYKNNEKRRLADFIPIKSHLERLFSNEAIASKMKINVQYRPDQSVKTIFDTPAWKQKVIDSGFAYKFPKGAVLHISADGTNPFVFNSYSVWPVYAEILNLGLDQSRKYHNICLLCLIHGPSAPTSLAGVCSQIAKDLNDIYQHPIEVYDSDDKQTITTSAMLYSITGDLPGSFF